MLVLVVGLAVLLTVPIHASKAIKLSPSIVLPLCYLCEENDQPTH